MIVPKALQTVFSNRPSANAKILPVNDRHLLRNNPDALKRGAARKLTQAPVDEAVQADADLRSLLKTLEAQQADMNRISKTIGQLMGQGDKEGAEAAKAQTGELKKHIQEGEAKQRELEARLEQLELEIPNPPHDDVPDGTTAEDNKVVREWGSKPAFDFEPKAHWDIAEQLGMVDFERASKISGSGFALYTGWGARLQRALFNYMIDTQTLEHGYQEIYPPYMVNTASLVGTGQLPKFGEDLYKADEDLWLIPTAEVPVTNIYRNEILDGSQLTKKMAAFSGCFRKEAGAAGKDTRGIQRMHQFDKVELVKLTKPEDSYNELDLLVADAEKILQMLGLHYRVVLLCAGDMSFSNSKCYDLEVWSPGVGRYLEISSCSNFEAFQARRMNLRFRRAPGEKPEFVHTLNGSGLATPRLFAAILETFQDASGAVTIPDPLRPYVRSEKLVSH